MKLFSAYLQESVEEKKYTFKIKVAGDLPDNCEDVMETALQQYKVSRFTKGKNTPIQSHLLDFPTLKNSSMTVFEVELDYPATSSVLSELLANCTGIGKESIRVRTPLEEANAAIEAENMTLDDKGQALLSQGYEKSNNQGLFGDKMISSFLKDVAKASKDKQLTQIKGVNEKLLAKSTHKEKAEAMPKVGPAKSLFSTKK